MPKLSVDVARLRRLVLVAPNVATGARATVVHQTMLASRVKALVDLHATRKHPDYLTNAIRYKGSPYMYICTNDMDGLLGKTPEARVLAQQEVSTVRGSGCDAPHGHARFGGPTIRSAQSK